MHKRVLALAGGTLTSIASFASRAPHSVGAKVATLAESQREALLALTPTAV